MLDLDQSAPHLDETAPQKVDLMLIVPHPDDEVFSCGGIFTKMAEANKRVATVTLTKGGAGRTLGICPQAELPSVRAAELRASLNVLGVSDVHIFDYPDFVPAADRGMATNKGLSGEPEKEVVPRLVSLIEAHKPRAVITFPPNGANGHPDHVVTNRFVVQALERSAHEVNALYYFAAEKPYSGAAREGFWGPEELRASHLPPTHYFDASPYVENKLRAMGQHETQARSVLTFMRSFPRRLLVESFHRAKPSYPEREGPRTVAWL